MKQLSLQLLPLLLIALYSCGVVQDAPKHSFADGYYSGRVNGQVRVKVYAENVNDSIYIRPLVIGTRPLSVDTAQKMQLVLPRLTNEAPIRSYVFRETSFDIDLMTVPFKVRPTMRLVPAQFNTDLDGVVYFGYRSDLYRLKYNRNPLGHYNLKVNHYGFSFGGFTGLGGTAVNPTVTENNIDREYDGVVWMKGVAAIIGINNITIGIALGWDTLLDTDHRYWIYQGKPWIGFAFGLNLN